MSVSTVFFFTIFIAFSLGVALCVAFLFRHCYFYFFALFHSVDTELSVAHPYSQAHNIKNKTTNKHILRKCSKEIKSKYEIRTFCRQLFNVFLFRCFYPHMWKHRARGSLLDKHTNCDIFLVWTDVWCLTKIFIPTSIKMHTMFYYISLLLLHLNCVNFGTPFCSYSLFLLCFMWKWLPEDVQTNYASFLCLSLPKSYRAKFHIHMHDITKRSITKSSYMFVYATVLFN